MKLFKEFIMILKYDMYFLLDKISLSFLKGMEFWHNIHSQWDKIWWEGV